MENRSDRACALQHEQYSNNYSHNYEYSETKLTDDIQNTTNGETKHVRKVSVKRAGFKRQNAFEDY